MIETLVILGANGDLTSRYLLPAIGDLLEAGLLPRRLRILAVDRTDHDDAAFREQAATDLHEHAAHLDRHTRDQLCQRLHYRRGDVTDPGELRCTLVDLNGPAAVYLALPNTLFKKTIRALTANGLPAGSRLVVEKPFGADWADARQLNTLIHEKFSEDHVFRVDHFLAKQTVLDILGLRFANRVFEPIWSNLHIQSVDIVWDETLALEGRASYYDGAGALRDMTQNHLLQLLALIAMEPPTSLGERDLRERKVDVLRATRAPQHEEMRAKTRRARYLAGRLPPGRKVPAYVDEPGVSPGRSTETYADVILTIDNWRWSGVPFRLRTGKALGNDRREIVLQLRPTAHQPFDQDAPADVLRLALDPSRIALDINLNGAGDPLELERRSLVAAFAEQDLPPYSLLLREIFEGDPTLSIRGDEAEECWRIVEPILDTWNAGEVPLGEYPAGSAGPG